MNPGDRIRLVGLDEDGLPFVRYGFVTPGGTGLGGADGTVGISGEATIAVLLDGELSDEVVPHDRVELVTVTNIELRLQGDDLVADPVLRRGLVAMWCAEAETAGVALDRLCPHRDGEGERDGDGSWLLAHATAGDDRYAIVACECGGDVPGVHVHAIPCTLPHPEA